MLAAFDETLHHHFVHLVRRRNRLCGGVSPHLSVRCPHERTLASRSLRLATRLDRTRPKCRHAIRHEFLRFVRFESGSFVEGYEAASRPRGSGLSIAGEDAATAGYRTADWPLLGAVLASRA